jgi:hypothetical protein
MLASNEKPPSSVDSEGPLDSLSDLLDDIHSMQESGKQGTSSMQEAIKSLSLSQLSSAGESGKNENSLLTTLIGRQSKKCCLLTDSHNEKVLAHQMKILSQEFPQISWTSILGRDLLSSNGAPADDDTLSKLKDILAILSQIEQEYSEGVYACKQKDYPRAQEILPGLEDRPNDNEEMDSTITAARVRYEEINECVQWVNQKIDQIIAK